MLILGAIAIILNEIIFRKLQHVNAVDSHSWTISINGVRSFPWPMFTGYELIILAVIIYTTAQSPKGRRFS
jgi:hypothetical protein